jgi:hypothetical protein
MVTMGKRPNNMPLRVAIMARGTGMPHTEIANNIAVNVPKKAAWCPLDRLMPNIYKRINNGIAATNADKARLPKGL